MAGWVVLYSITDIDSFHRATANFNKLKSLNLLRGSAAILVANKCELVRSRAVQYEGGCAVGCIDV